MATQRTAVISYLNKFGLRTSGQLLLALSARSLVSSYFAYHRDGWLSCYWFPCQKKEQKSSRQKQKSNPSLSQHSHFTAVFPLLWLCPIPLVLQIPLVLLCLDSLSLIQLPSFFLPESSYCLSLLVQCWIANTFANVCLKSGNSKNLTGSLSEAHECPHALFLQFPHQ